MENSRYSQASTLELLKTADIKLLRRFLTSKVLTNETLAKELWAFLDKSISKKGKTIDPKEFEKLIQKNFKEIKETLKKSENPWHGAVEYKVRSSINKVVTQSLKEFRAMAPTKALRIKLQLDVLALLGRNHIESEDESYENMMRSITYDFKAIFEEGDLETRKLLLDECLRFLTDYESYSCEAREIEDFVYESFGDLFSSEIKGYTNQRIDHYLSISNRKDDQERELGEYVAVMLGILYHSGASETELIDFAKPNLENKEVHGWFLWYYKDTKQWDKAIDLVLKSMTLDKGHDTMIYYQKYLKDLYILSGQTDKCEQLLLNIIKDSPYVETEAYCELKAMVTPKVWDEYHQSIFLAKKEQNWIRARYLAEEKLFDRLAQMILSSTDDYYLFDDYAHQLPTTYNSKVLHQYEAYFSQRATSSKTRKDYKGLLNRLEDAHKIPGGKELTQRLMNRWLVSFHNKPAFCEEIRSFRSKSKPKDKV